MYQGRTLVFGHRGARAYAPMNTLPSFELAAKQGAHGVELDVHLSRDGYPIVLHDFTVDATTDGRGKAREMPLAQLKALDAGRKFGDEFTSVRIPTLDEVFEAIGKKLYVNVEIKSESLDTDGIEKVVADRINRYRMNERVIVSSFNPHTLQRFRAIMPNVPIGYLYSADYSFDSHLMNDLPHEARHPEDALVNPSFMAWAKRSGYRVNTWTVNDPARARELRDMGVDAIITDKPDVILAALKS
jgi:glycerophosphoryl diester phosphodiesterase